ncbi:ABC transporter substrate-binding protein [Shouchella hunanensis]|uniref:Iron-siderophore ABC transporter substrate-binding protein n=1 Tax=Shouchella hunanensis TaxID=766894 RepID=A0ABY7W7S4_9BACI|nr:iron-siderophore ABC transporter substrate-binding protein [Shouchella hunanensis]WDF04924.1 iron-siderophore ABC transporter substrate-binding protein [Shouchella hunanensis]
MNDTWKKTSLVCMTLLLSACSTSTEENIEHSDNEVIEHIKGEFVVEDKPERVVVLDVQFLDQMMALDEIPVGTVYAETDNGLPEYLGEAPSDATLLGTYLEPNLEAIISTDPDLIIATDTHEDIYDQLERIAPTIMFDRMEDWQTVLLSFGTLLNQTEKAETVIADYTTKVDELKADLEESVGDEVVSLIRPRDDMIRLHTTSHRTAQILYDDLGLTPPEMATVSSDSSTMISLEVMPDLEADHLFLLQDDTNLDLTASFQASSVWQGLDAVKNDHVYEKNTGLWIGYYGPIAINLVVDQIAEELL